MDWRRLLAASPSFPPAGNPAGRWLLLAEGASPSLDYYVWPQLRRLGIEAVLRDSRQPPAGDESSFAGAVVVRYLPDAWVENLRRLRRRGCPVVYFMDDDLMDPASHVELPEDYRRKLRRLALRQRGVIESVCSGYWVSTTALAAKHPAWHAQLLAPDMPPLATASPLRLCYHGTSSHLPERRWLHDFVARLQASCDNTHFTIVGDLEVNRAFRGLPRVSVLHPLGWANYVAQATAYPCEILLAPLVSTPFNIGRGPTKFFDAARLGAVGLYADQAPYRGVVRHDVDGLLLPPEIDAWLAAVQGLAVDPERLRRLAAACRQRAQAGPLA